MGGKKQLAQREVEISKQLPMARIRVERIIGLLKNKYTLLLKWPIPVNLLKNKGDTDVANIDQVPVVCVGWTKGKLKNIAGAIQLQLRYYHVIQQTGETTRCSRAI